MSKQKGAKSGLDILPRERFGAVYMAYKATDDVTITDEVDALIKKTTADQSEIQRDFLFLLVKQNKNLSFAKFFLLFKLTFVILCSDLPKANIATAITTKISLLGRKHPGFEYDYETYVPEEEATFTQTVERHDMLSQKEAMFAIEVYNQLQGFGAKDEAKKPTKKYLIVLTIEEQKQMLQQLLQTLTSQVLLKRAFADDSDARILQGCEIVSEPHIPHCKHLEPLQQGVVFKQRSELEKEVLRTLKPKAAAMYREMVK